MKIRKYTRIGCGLMKIAIIGSAGSGKSTLARRIGEKLKLPVFHMDTLFWKPGWEAVSTEELTENHDQILKNPSWVIDGNYHKVWGKRMEAADLIIFLDLPEQLAFTGLLNVFSNTERKQDRTWRLVAKKSLIGSLSAIYGNTRKQKDIMQFRLLNCIKIGNQQ